MESITLQRVLPDAFADDPAPSKSGVWLRETTFRKGEYTLVEAASGTGKSSLCAFLYGSRTDYAGRILFDGADSRTLSARQWTTLRRRSLSLLFQDLRLFDELTVGENIRVKNDLTQFKTPDEIDRLLEAAGIAGKSNTPVGKLSLGQQQRVAFIRCLCQPFDFILLDEPFSQIAPLHVATLQTLIRQEKATKGILLTDHMYRHVTGIADRLYVMADGQAYPCENDEDLVRRGYLNHL